MPTPRFEKDLPDLLFDVVIFGSDAWTGGITLQTIQRSQVGFVPSECASWRMPVDVIELRLNVSRRGLKTVTR